MPSIDFTSVFEGIPGMFVVFSPSLTVITASNDFLQTTFTERDKIIGKRLADIYPGSSNNSSIPADDNVMASMNYVLQYHQPHKMTVHKYFFLQQDGSVAEKYWELLNAPVLNEQNEIIYILHSIVDVTAREKKSAEPANIKDHIQEKVKPGMPAADLKAAEQVESLLRQINQSHDAIYTLDTHFQIVSWNKGAQNLYGYSAAEALGKDSNTLLQTALKRNEIDDANREVRLKDYWSGELKRKTRSGKDIYVHASATTIRDSAGMITGYTAVSYDITEQVRLREQVEHLANIVEQSSEAIISRGTDQRLISWNKGAEVLFGYTKEEAIGKTAKELGIIKFTDAEIAALEQEILCNGSWQAEKEYFHKNGSSFFGVVTASKVKSQYDDTTAMAFIIKDISPHKQLEQQLKNANDGLEEKVKVRTAEIIKKEKRFRALIENSHDIISMMDESLRVIYRSPAAARITGWPDEMIIDSICETNIHPDDLERVRSIMQEIQMKPGKPVSCLVRARHRDGHYLWLEGTLTNFLQVKYVNAIVYNFRDVTKRVEAEEKLKASDNLFRALISNSNDIIALMDESFKVIYRSPAATRILGWTDEDMVGVDATRNIYPEDREYAASIVKEVMANPGKEIHTRFRMLHKQGHYLWLEGTIANLLEVRDVNAIVHNFRDVTERVETEEKLVASEKQYRSTLNNMLEGIQIHDFNWRYVYVNDAALAKYDGQQREEFIGNTLMEKNPGIEDTQLFKALNRCMNERVAQRFETEFVFSDGIRSDFQLSIQPHPAGILILSVDLTKMRKAEKALAEEQNKFARIVQASPGLIYSFRMAADGTMSFPYASKAFEEIFGVPYENAADNVAVIINSFLEEDKEILLSSIATSARDMAPWQLQFRYHHPRKGLVWIEGSSVPIAAEEGSVLWHGVLTDVTERKLAEDKINEQNIRLKTLTDNLPGLMLYQLAAESFEKRKFTYVSNTVTTLTGKSPEEVMNDPSILYNLLEKEDVPAMIAAENESFNKMSCFNQEVRSWDYKGNQHWLNIISVPRQHVTGQLVWDGFLLDITERKNAALLLEKSYEEKQALAERMAIILNTLPANIALLDKNGVIIEVNDAWKNFADENGFAGNSHCLGNNYVDIAENAFGESEEDGSEVASGIRAVLAGKLNEFVYEYTSHAPHVKKWFRMVVTPLLGKEQGGAVVMHIDISELRRLEQERLQAKMQEQKKIAQAMLMGEEKERNHLGRELHDNINQILAGTKMFLYMAGKKNQEVKELIKFPLELLDTSIEEIRLLCHKMVTPLKNIDLEALVNELLTRLKQQSDIKTDFSYLITEGMLPDDLKLNIYRIIQELINNSMKYAMAHKIAVSVTTHTGFVDVTVADDGKGFDPDKKRTGIGLSNIINRVKSFNGEIDIKSAAGKGSIISINIPVLN